jgi:hypothetical protein
MKKILLILPLATFLFSCGGGCDTSSADGAADCACNSAQDYYEAFEAKDEDKMKDIDGQMQSWENEVEGHIDKGDYSENDVEAALRKRDCKM